MSSNVKNLELNQRLYEGCEVIYWHKLYKGMKFHKVLLEMLDGDGVAIPVNCRVSGDIGISERQIRIVIFDSHYVVSKLRGELKHLLALDRSEFNLLMEKVYEPE